MRLGLGRVYSSIVPRACSVLVGQWPQRMPATELTCVKWGRGLMSVWNPCSSQIPCSLSAAPVWKHVTEWGHSKKAQPSVNEKCGIARLCQESVDSQRCSLWRFSGSVWLMKWATVSLNTWLKPESPGHPNEPEEGKEEAMVFLIHVVPESIQTLA